LAFNPRILFFGLVLTFSLCFNAPIAGAGDSAPLADAASAASARKVVVTYYLTNLRCPSCLNIEKWTSETVKEKFAQPMASGTLEWAAVNIDAPGNYHFVKDYSLYTKSVILSERVDGKEVRWKNLEKVWTLLGSERKFRSYIEDEVAAFLKGK